MAAERERYPVLNCVTLFQYMQLLVISGRWRRNIMPTTGIIRERHAAAMEALKDQRIVFIFGE